MNQLFESGGQSIGVSASASVVAKFNVQDHGSYCREASIARALTLSLLLCCVCAVVSHFSRVQLFMTP